MYKKIKYLAFTFVLKFVDLDKIIAIGYNNICRKSIYIIKSLI